jgi:hypothetical protein
MAKKPNPFEKKGKAGKEKMCPKCKKPKAKCKCK